MNTRTQKRIADFRTSLANEGWRLTECEMENAWAAAKLVWAMEGLTGGTERYYALAHVIEDMLMEKWRFRKLDG